MTLVGKPKGSNPGVISYELRFGLRKLKGWHSGLVSRIIRDLDSVLLYVVKVTGSSGWIGTVCNQSNMENGSSLHIVLPDFALYSITIYIL